MRTSAHCQSDSYDVNNLLIFLKLSHTTWQYRDVIKVESEDQSRTIFFFSYGVSIFWGYSPEEEKKILSQLSPFLIEILVFPEDEELSYSYGKEMSIINDHLTLPSQDALAKLAISHAMAQSIKLKVFEKTIQHTIQKTKFLPEELATKGKINLSRQEINRLRGKVFRDKSLLNLHSDILDTPEFIWEHTQYEPLYIITSKYHDTAQRIEIQNNRISVLHELLEILQGESQYKHFVKLERIIILLIFIEIVITIFKEIFG
jgi:uncharacterized Rmd1/YagE family protein